jgi:acetyl esterase/lipase
VDLRPAVLALLALAACSTGGTPASPPSSAPAAPSPGPATDHLDVTYATHPRPLRLDLHLPAGTPPFPVVVWVHGGGWQSGDKRLNPNHPALRQRGRGYAVASVEYRLSGEAAFPAQIQDCKAALRWLRANAAAYGLDPGHIAAWGSSAGGHLVALLGTSSGVPALADPAQGHASQPDAVQAVVDWYGPTDFLLMPGGHHAADSPESRLLGCDIDECPDRAAFASPITYVDPGDPPFLIQHGSRDGTVDPNQSALLHAALLAAAVPSTHVVLEGAGHGGPEFTTAANLALVEAFLDARLRQLAGRPLPVAGQGVARGEALRLSYSGRPW